ncbi:hypothetical protein PMW_156 [Pseudomonas phage phiPMW]|uniref:Uncharacterized protein n=1 Tax=Pseudomonas phage phiPMW TaxID=1815582 RepID=A0A1S5R1K6_9CAUD|nr:hypothetical protein FDG97_gp194 [Pseudomonas phage phiPMW]ANA49281.1 hypothetical protein PMW_156 [Pseudomonas phage phiPMW]
MVRDYAENLYLQIKSIERKLEDINGDEGQFELVQIVLNAADDLRGVMSDIDTSFELGMED